MSLQDDVVYLCLLLASIGLGFVSRRLFHDASSKRNFSTACGLVVLFLVSGRHGLFCLVCFALQAALVLSLPSSAVHVVSFAAQFSYLFFFRTANYLWPDTFGAYPPHTNAIQMMLTLKVCECSFVF